MQRKRTRNAPKLRLSSRLHWATRLLFVTNWTWRYNVHPSPLRMLFLFGWPPFQRSDMTLVEVSQHAYGYLCIRTIVLFVFLRNSCKPDMVLVYILLNKLCLWPLGPPVRVVYHSPLRHLREHLGRETNSSTVPSSLPFVHANDSHTDIQTPCTQLVPWAVCSGLRRSNVVIY